MSVQTMRRVFTKLRNGNHNAAKRQKGSGRKMKLSADNEGLVAAAAALNAGTPIPMAVEICNSRNAVELKVCRNTLLSSLKKYTDHDIRTIPRRKTGKKDKESEWAKARLVLSNAAQGAN